MDREEEVGGWLGNGGCGLWLGQTEPDPVAAVSLNRTLDNLVCGQRPERRGDAKICV